MEGDEMAGVVARTAPRVVLYQPVKTMLSAGGHRVQPKIKGVQRQSAAGQL